jgi:hypothetical protein
LHDNVGQARGIGCKRASQGGNLWQAFVLQTGGELIGQFALATSLMGHGQKFDHDATGLPFRQLFKQGIEGLPVSLAWEELVPINKIEQRHRLVRRNEWVTCR